MSTLLCADKISLSFGGLKALSDFSLTMMAGELQGLIGPNGAGKTTCFNLLTGVYAPQSGDITVCDKSVHGLRCNQITKQGLARTFQNIRLFGHMSVLDNLLVASRTQITNSLASTMIRTSKHRREEAAMRIECLELLEVFGLRDLANESARNLPYGSQRRLEMARALATHPRVLLLDEPAAGMNPQEKKVLAELIRDIRKRFAVAILLIEHDMTLVMSICEKITVLDHGEIIATGTPDEIKNNSKVIEAYLGTPMDAAAV